MPVPSSQPFSAHVEAWLRVDGRKIAVGSVGPNFCILRDGENLPEGCRAELELVVDHRPIVWSVKLPGGAVPFDNRIEFEIDTPDAACHSAGDMPQKLRLLGFLKKRQQTLF